MSGPIRNISLARGVEAAGGTTLVYTVPAGFGVILKSIYAQEDASQAGTGAFYIGGPGGSPIIALFNQPITALEIFGWQGWTVLNAGDGIYVQALGTGVRYWVAGAVLPFAP